MSSMKRITEREERWALCIALNYSDNYTSKIYTSHRTQSFSRCILFDQQSSELIYPQQLSSESHGISRKRIGSETIMPSFHLFSNPIRSIAISPTNSATILASSSHKEICVYDMQYNTIINS